MSERGSFVTEYIHCQKCLEVVKTLLLGKDKHLTGVLIPHWNGLADEFLAIVAGKVGGAGPGDELSVFADEIIPQLEINICHPLRIAVIAEQGHQIFEVEPRHGTTL